jgi:SAM-dependent methyltransferase
MNIDFAKITLAALLGVTVSATQGCGGTSPAPVAGARRAATGEVIQAKSNQLLLAHDRGDVATVAAELSPDFLHFEGSKPTNRDGEIESLRKRLPGAPHIGAREWSEQHVYVQKHTATFFGKANEKMAGNDSHGGYNFEGWYTLTWQKRDGDWKLLLWTWQRAGLAAERDQWNEIYRNSIGFNKLPNQLLVDTVAKLQPGTALDVAQGEGRNALYLAQQGWKVTGVDFSDEGLRLAKGRAEELKVSIDTVNADLATYEFGESKWDLITLIYAGDDPSWPEKIKRALRPGGTVVIEYFHLNDVEGQIDGSFARGELAKMFADGFKIIRDDIVDGVPDWAMDKASLVRFVATKK